MWPFIFSNSLSIVFALNEIKCTRPVGCASSKAVAKRGRASVDTSAVLAVDSVFAHVHIHLDRFDRTAELLELSSGPPHDLARSVSLHTRYALVACPIPAACRAVFERSKVSPCRSASVAELHTILAARVRAGAVLIVARAAIVTPGTLRVWTGITNRGLGKAGDERFEGRRRLRCW